MNRVAVIRDGVVDAVIAAPEWANELEFARWVATMTEGPFRGCVLRVLRGDEVAASGHLVQPDGSFAAPPTPLETTLDAINAQTAARIAAGFEFRGARVSLSIESQTTISNAYTIRASLPYPIPWSTLDDKAFVTIASAADVEALYAAATTAVLLARTEGNARKAAAIAESSKR